MEINIIRGQNQIGGSIIEVSSKNTKIILDVGSNLEDKEIVVPEIEGLFKGKAKYDGVLTCVRPSMKKYLESYPNEFSFEGCVLFYSMWEGYKKQENMKEFLKFMEEKGVKTISLHTSGHADEKDFDKLIKKVEPKIIIPVHTENSEWFKRYEKCKVIYDKNIIKI